MFLVRCMFYLSSNRKTKRSVSVRGRDQRSAPQEILANAIAIWKFSSSLVVIDRKWDLKMAPAIFHLASLPFCLILTSLWISLCTCESCEFLSLDTLYIHPLDINYSFVSRGTAFTAAPPPTHPSHPPTCLSPSPEQFSWSDTPYIVLVFLWCPVTGVRAS